LRHVMSHQVTACSIQSMTDPIFPALGDLHDLGGVAEGFKRLMLQIGTDIESAHTTVVGNDGQDAIRFRTDFFDSHVESWGVGVNS
jgi:hypothetical protein